MPHPPRTRTLPLLAAALILTACSDGGDAFRPDPVAPDGPASAIAAVTCTASTQARTVRCDDPRTPEGMSPLIVGGQNQYVTLTSSNIAVTADTFAFDVTVTNLIPQPLGTTDFGTADPAGIRVFFQYGPASTGAGAVQVANEDGAAAFTAAEQPYFQYAGLLEPDSTSAAKRWKLQFTPEVTSFTFTVYVAAAVPYEDGYISGNPYVLTLNPGETRGLSATAHSAVGNPLADPISWVTSAPGTVSVNGQQATGGSTGFAELTPTTGTPRPTDYTTAVSVCQATVVGSGHSSSQAVEATDCFSAFGSAEYRPSTSFYGDLYRVTLAAGQTVTITLDTGEQLDTYLVLADPLGFPVAVNDDDEEELLGVGSRIVYTATTAGVYVFEASTFNGLDTGAYTLGVTVN